VLVFTPIQLSFQSVGYRDPEPAPGPHRIRLQLTGLSSYVTVRVTGRATG
jgi:hypothetical protein